MKSLSGMQRCLPAGVERPNRCLIQGQNGRRLRMQRRIEGVEDVLHDLLALGHALSEMERTAPQPRHNPFDIGEVARRESGIIPAACRGH
jgi:hypothetical protein